MNKPLIVVALAASLAATNAQAQSTIGCDAAVADAYEALARTTNAYRAALGPNIHVGNYPAEMRDEATAFSEERIELYRKLESFSVTIEDFAYQIRRCARK